MAYMNQEKKAKIAAELKKVVPLDWKYSLAVDNHSTIVMTIRSAPMDLIDMRVKLPGAKVHYSDLKYMMVNEHYPESYYEGELLVIFEKIIAALNLNNHDNSDITTDYFDVGHYVNLSIGSWNKPFVATHADMFAEAV